MISNTNNKEWSFSDLVIDGVLNSFLKSIDEKIMPGVS